MRKLLQDAVAPDGKALATRMDALELQMADRKAELREFKGDVQEASREFRGDVKEEFRQLRHELHGRDERTERRVDRILSALDVYKDVQDLREFRIRMEERGRLSA